MMTRVFSALAAMLCLMAAATVVAGPNDNPSQKTSTGQRGVQANSARSSTRFVAKQPGENNDLLPPVAPAPVRRADLVARPGHIIKLNANGTLDGEVGSVDPASFALVPTADSTVLFIQNGRVVARAKTGLDGR